MSEFVQGYWENKQWLWVRYHLRFLKLSRRLLMALVIAYELDQSYLPFYKNNYVKWIQICKDNDRFIGYLTYLWDNYVFDHHWVPFKVAFRLVFEHNHSCLSFYIKMKSKEWKWMEIMIDFNRFVVYLWKKYVFD